MNWADYAILAIIGISSLVSLQRGFAREALSLGTWVLAFIIALLFNGSLAMLMAEQIEHHSLRSVVAFSILFFVTLIVGGMVNRLVVQLVHFTGLTGTDRVFGFVFGLARGLVIVLVMVLMGRQLDVFSADRWWHESALIPHFSELGDWAWRQTAEMMGEAVALDEPQQQIVRLNQPN